METNVASGSLGMFRSEFQALSMEIVACLERCQRPRYQDPSWLSEFQMRLQDLASEIQVLRERYAREIEPKLQVRMQELSAGFESYRAVLEEKRAALRAVKLDLRTRAQTLSREYEQFLLELKHAGLSEVSRSAHLKPFNPWRNLFHAFNGCFAAFLYHAVLSREQALVILVPLLVLATGVEITRKWSDRWNDFLVDRVFGLVSRPKERHTVNSATWYLLAVVLSVFLFSKEAVELGLLVLAISDPVASLVGKRWGRVKLRGQKSLQGTLAFFFSAAMVIWLYVGFLMQGLDEVQQAGLVLLAALAGTFAELYGDRVDDNFGVLLSVSGVVTAVLGVLSLGGQ